MASRKHEICFKNFDEALAESPETYGYIDVLCGGWPCQDNSIAGSRKGNKGERSGLYREFFRVAELFRPKWIVAENVPGLFTVNGGEDFWGVISDLDSLGYCVSWDVLDSKNFGVAQQRERIIIVGSLGSIGSAKVLFEQKSDYRNNSTGAEGRKISPCINTRSGERNDPQTEQIIATTIRTSESGKRTQGYIARTIRCETGKASPKNFSDGIIANTVTAGQRGVERRPRQGNYIAEIDPNRERKIAGVSYELDSPRGVVIGNAVTVSVAEWIGKRIMEVERSL